MLRLGSRVRVDLPGIYLAICAGCGSVTLAIPGGACSKCSAPEALLVRDPRPPVPGTLR